MSTLTPRVSLLKPAANESMAAVGTWWNPNMDIIDQNAGLRQLTTGTLPVSPYVGQHVYTTDNGQIVAWTGTQWRVRATRNAAASCIMTANQTYPAGNVAVTFSTQNVQNFTVVSNQRIAAQQAGVYLITASINWISYARNLNFGKLNSIVVETSGGTPRYSAVHNEAIQEAGDVVLTTVRYQMTMIAEIAVGDRIFVNLNHSSGVNQGVQTGKMDVELICPFTTYATTGP